MENIDRDLIIKEKTPDFIVNLKKRLLWEKQMSIYRHRENRTPSRGGQVEAKQAEENFRKALCRDRFSEKKIGLQETQKKDWL